MVDGWQKGDDQSVSGAPFRIFVLANGTSVFGDYLNLIALNLFAFALTGSAFVTGMLMALRLVAGLVVATAAGRWATERSRRAILVTADVVQALVWVSLALAVETSALAESLLFVAAIVAGAGSTSANVALRASIPEMVGGSSRVRANSLLSSARAIATGVGFAAGGALVAVGGFQIAFALNAATFLVSACVLSWLPLPFRGGADAPRDVAARRRRLIGNPFAALSFRRSLAPVLLALVVIRAADAFGSGSHNVALPIFFSDDTPADAATFYGGFWTAWAIGNLTANRVVSWLATHRSFEPGSRAFAAGTIAMSSAFVVAFLGWSLVPLLVVAMVAGMADGFTEVSYTSRLQQVPDDSRGPTFALSAFAETAGLGTGMIITASLVGWIGTLPAVALLHGVAIALAVTFLLGLGNLARRSSARPASALEPL